ncbi:GSCFA domain-containing protein [Sphingobium fuliginis]|uniref:GSCFA domain-containing protein n=1 Tax=Sphingobium fuliginis (strain ATCC 27551) TaxID=336203 RepID=A0ABQ1EMG3_SPHSA|nr:GSCFA domain-containing protein [Sphingobium fuliginis]RYM01126.1 hypothetical protein EWH10_03525 [Sphingobium fuliginis]GFZ77825.1 hypothetical protein GCM10019071_02850 [Sphingobium fuliginis]
MRLSIIANCQKDSLATCIAALNHGFEIDHYMIHEVMANPTQLRAILENSAFIFSHLQLRSMVPAELAHKVTYFPNITFSAYHPDLTFVRGRNLGGDIETLLGPLYIYNSALAVFGYREGIPLDEIVTFYNADVYARLGYFDQWQDSRRQLLSEGDACQMPLGGLLEKWSRGKAFMYSSNHPTLAVMEDIARELLQRVGMFYFAESKHEYLVDPLKAQPIWPIYPEIAERLGLRGSTAFKINDPHGTLELRDFVRASYDTFANYDRETLESLNVDISGFAEKLGLRSSAPKVPAVGNPYAGADKVQFWKNSVARPQPEDMDPVVGPKFLIMPQDKVATAGSCFAQHIARTLKASGFYYYVPESPPIGMEEEEAKACNYGVFSARFGNIYTVRQLLQLIERVEGAYCPEEAAWLAKEGHGLVDPYRPQIEPNGYADEQALHASRDVHYKAVRTMLREMDIFVFTLGLTEGWRSRSDGAVFPLAPGVAGGIMDETRYEFINFDVDSIRQDLHEVIAHLKRLNPACRIILTVSPVPLIATFEHRHALVSTTYSKAVLRVVADEMWRKYDHVDYFPSYEIITGSYSRGAYFADDLREVREEGVAHVMRTFMRHYAQTNEVPAQLSSEREERAEGKQSQASRSALFDIVCDEEAIAKF